MMIINFKKSKEKVLGLAVGYDTECRPHKCTKKKTFMLLVLCWVLEVSVIVDYIHKPKVI